MTSQITLLPFVFLNLESVERKKKITKIEHLLNEKSFFDEIKKTKHFLKFLQGYHLMKK